MTIKLNLNDRLSRLVSSAKRLISIVLLGLPFCSIAQVSIPMKTDSKKDIYAFIAEVKANARGDYQLTDSVMIPEKTYGAMYFTLTDGKENYIVVEFFKSTEGGNKHLEVPGKTTYRFARMKGKYLDIFPMWQKFVDPAADKEALSQRISASKQLDENGTKRNVTIRLDKECSISVI